MADEQVLAQQMMKKQDDEDRKPLHEILCAFGEDTLLRLVQQEMELFLADIRKGSPDNVFYISKLEVITSMLEDINKIMDIPRQ